MTTIDLVKKIKILQSFVKHFQNSGLCKKFWKIQKICLKKYFAVKTTSGAPRIGQISYSDVWEADKFIEQDFLTPLRAFTPEKLEDMDREDDDDRQEISNYNR